MSDLSSVKHPALDLKWRTPDGLMRNGIDTMAGLCIYIQR